MKEYLHNINWTDVCIDTIILTTTVLITMWLLGEFSHKTSSAKSSRPVN